MVESPLYRQIYRALSSQHPDLLDEITAQDLDEGQRRYYALGSFIDIKPEYQQTCGRYQIWILTDHPKADDEIELVAALCHEYGHYLCRTQLYPKLGRLGKLVLSKLEQRPAVSRAPDWDYPTKAITVIEEFLAWVLGLRTLRQFGGFTQEHLRVAVRCFKTYLPRLKVW